MLLEVGVQVTEALRSLAAQADHPHLRLMAQAMADFVETGSPLSASMRVPGTIFRDMEVGLVEAGEKSGSLTLVLEYLAVHEEKKAASLMKIRSALVYPCFVSGVLVLMLLVVPALFARGLEQLIADIGGTVPGLTAFVLGLAGVVGSVWFWATLAFVGLGGAFCLRRALQDASFRQWLGRVTLAIPIIGPALRHAAVGRFSRALAVQLAGGVVLGDAIFYGAQASGEPTLFTLMDAASAALEDGATLTEALRRSQYFPPLFLHMMEAGEETGKLPILAEQAADLYEVEVEYRLDAAVVLLEPLVTAATGVAVAVMVLAVVLPILQVVSGAL